MLHDIFCSVGLDRVAPEEQNALAGQQLNLSQVSETSRPSGHKKVLSALPRASVSSSKLAFVRALTLPSWSQVPIGILHRLTGRSKLQTGP